VPGRTRRGWPQAGPADDGRSVAAGIVTSWRTERQQLKSGQTTRQRPDSQLADRPPDSPHRPARVLSSIGAASTAPDVPLPGAESKVVAVRRVPAVRVESLDWTLVGGRRQLLRLLGVDVRSCIEQRSHRGWASAVPQARGQGRGRCRHRRGQAPRCARRPHARGSRRHSLTNHGFRAHRQPGRRVGLSVGALLSRATTRLLVASGNLKPPWAASRCRAAR
jgi:hypothetical protein